jgi:hypothetical protein
MPDSRRIGATTLSLALLLGYAADAHARSETQVWVSESASTKLDEDTTAGLDLSQRFLDTPTARHQYLARVTLNRRVAKGVEIGGGFAWSQIADVNEYRPFEEVTLSQGILAFRTRLEQRMYDNADRTVWRLRERLQAAVPLDSAKRWTATVNGEALFNLNSANVAKQAGLTQIRTLIGLRHSFNSQLSLALSYQRQQTLVRRGEDIVTHQPIIALAARF